MRLLNIARIGSHDEDGWIVRAKIQDKLKTGRTKRQQKCIFKWVATELKVTLLAHQLELAEDYSRVAIGLPPHLTQGSGYRMRGTTRASVAPSMSVEAIAVCVS
jgi:hypothetical protein